MKVKGYATGTRDVNRSVEDDLQELVQLFAHVVQSQKRGGANHPPQAFVDAFEQNHLGPRHVRVLMNLVFDDAQSVSTLAGRIYARASGERLYHHHWLPGTAANWQNHTLANSSSFTVELPAGSLTPQQVRTHVHAVLHLAEATRGAPHA